MICRCWCLAALVSLSLLTLFAAGQAVVSAGPPRLDEVRTIYFASSSDDFVLLLKKHFEKWGLVTVTSKPEEADAILSCRTESKIVVVKAVVRQTVAEVTLVDRRTQKSIWRTTKSTTFDLPSLADDIVDQLKKDRRKVAIPYY